MFLHFESTFLYWIEKIFRKKNHNFWLMNNFYLDFVWMKNFLLFCSGCWRTWRTKPSSRPTSRSGGSSSTSAATCPCLFSNWRTSYRGKQRRVSAASSAKPRVLSEWWGFFSNFFFQFFFHFVIILHSKKKNVIRRCCRDMITNFNSHECRQQAQRNDKCS